MVVGLGGALKSPVLYANQLNEWVCVYILKLVFLNWKHVLYEDCQPVRLLWWTKDTPGDALRLPPGVFS